MISEYNILKYDITFEQQGPIGAWAKEPVPGAAGARPGLSSNTPGQVQTKLGTGSFAHATVALVSEFFMMVQSIIYIYI